MGVLANFCFLFRNVKALIWDEGGHRMPDGKPAHRVKTAYTGVISKRRKHQRSHQIHLKCIENAWELYHRQPPKMEGGVEERLVKLVGAKLNNCQRLGTLLKGVRQQEAGLPLRFLLSEDVQTGNFSRARNLIPSLPPSISKDLFIQQILIKPHYVFSTEVQSMKRPNL